MADDSDFHERLDRQQVVKLGSERSFGIVFAAVFLVIGLWPLIDGGAVRLWSLGIAVAFVAVAAAAPAWLRPLNKLWHGFGLLLHRLVNPLVMGFLFFVTVTPTGLLMRLFGKRPLPLAFDSDAPSYWIVRQPPGPDPKTMSQQF